MSNYDFIAIGDTATDAFIRLENPSAHIDIDKGLKEICMHFAEKVPYEEVFIVPAVGNSANAAVAASRLGLRSALVSNVGDDYFGKECVAALNAEQVATDYVAVHQGAKTNYHYVLWYEDDRTILIKHEAYEYRLPEIGEPKWVYLSSAGEEAIAFHDVVAEYLRAHPGVKFAFQPGTYQMKAGTERLSTLYRRADVLICNHEEAGRILRTKEEDFGKLMRMLHDLGPKIVSITDGVKGAYASDGRAAWFMPPYPDPKSPLERTGAGDAYSATFVAALALGNDIPTALRWAPINSMSVVQQVGARAGLLTREQLEMYLAKAPPDYKPKPL